jgi:hypothetical protein
VEELVIESSVETTTHAGQIGARPLLAPLLRVQRHAQEPAQLTSFVGWDAERAALGNDLTIPSAGS